MSFVTKFVSRTWRTCSQGQGDKVWGFPDVLRLQRAWQLCKEARTTSSTLTWALNGARMFVGAEKTTPGSSQMYVGDDVAPVRKKSNTSQLSMSMTSVRITRGLGPHWSSSWDYTHLKPPIHCSPRAQFENESRARGCVWHYGIPKATQSHDSGAAQPSAHTWTVIPWRGTSGPYCHIPRRRFQVAGQFTVKYKAETTCWTKKLMKITG